MSATCRKRIGYLIGALAVLVAIGLTYRAYHQKLLRIERGMVREFRASKPISIEVLDGRQFVMSSDPDQIADFSKRHIVLLDHDLPTFGLRSEAQWLWIRCDRSFNKVRRRDDGFLEIYQVQPDTIGDARHLRHIQYVELSGPVSMEHL